MENFVQQCIENAENNISKLTVDILNIEGMSGHKTRHFYNNLLEYPDGARYLEIGTWKGSSVCSAMYKNKANVVCIDDFSQFSGPRNEFLKNFTQYKGDNNALFIEGNCWEIDPNILGEKFNIYMYDGGHTYDDQYKALTHYIPCLDDTFIFVVDDWNWKPVRDGTFDAIKDLNLKINFKHEIRLTNDDSHTPYEAGGRFTWHNGIGIFVLSKQ